MHIAPAWRLLQGHAHGIRGPVLLGTIALRAGIAWNLPALQAWLVAEAGLRVEEVERCLQPGFGHGAVLALLARMEASAPSPVHQAGTCIGELRTGDGFTVAEVAIPSLHARYTGELLAWLAQGVNLAHGVPPQLQPEAARKRLEAARGELLALLKGGGVNVTRIAHACADLGLPWRMLGNGLLQAGSGRWARLFRSTLTERVPALGVALAASKAQTAALLQQHGLPVPRHIAVASADAAVAAAHALGYPVVVKPENLERGQGVFAGLANDEQVRTYYAQAAALSRRILVEKHVDGEDFRLTVENGRLVKAIGRQPGGVTGDGVHSIAELVRRATASAPPRARGSMVTLDDEAHAVLAEQGRDVAGVPAAGEFVVLRRRANMSTGGTSRDVMALVHPDNALLAVRAALALRLDVAGVDLIIPDIAVSWMDCVAGICEVNAQPQISTEFAPEVYHDLLRRMLPAPGRLHTVVVLGEPGDAAVQALVRDAADGLAASMQGVLSIRADGTWLDGVRIAPPQQDAFAAARMAELDVQARAAVCAMRVDDVLHKGSPWLHLDEVRVAAAEGPDAAPALAQCLRLLQPHIAPGAPRTPPQPAA